MPLKYQIRRVGPARFEVTPVDSLPSWSFEMGAREAHDQAEIISEADLTRPWLDPFPDLSDVSIEFTVIDDSLGSGSLRS